MFVSDPAGALGILHCLRPAQEGASSPSTLAVPLTEHEHLLIAQLAAGLRAVFIPHPHTWSLEHEEVVPVDGRTLVTIERFTDLRVLF